MIVCNVCVRSHMCTPTQPAYSQGTRKRWVGPRRRWLHLKCLDASLNSQTCLKNTSPERRGGELEGGTGGEQGMMTCLRSLNRPGSDVVSFTTTESRWLHQGVGLLARPAPAYSRSSHLTHAHKRIMHTHTHTHLYLSLSYTHIHTYSHIVTKHTPDNSHFNGKMNFQEACND